VRLPHDWAISGPFDPDENGYAGKLPWKGVGWYRKTFVLDKIDSGRRVYFDFDGVMAFPKVYVNGRLAGQWDYGYMSFRVDATPYVKFDGTNVIAVQADTRKNRAIDIRPGPEGENVIRTLRQAHDLAEIGLERRLAVIGCRCVEIVRNDFAGIDPGLLAGGTRLEIPVDQQVDLGSARQRQPDVIDVDGAGNATHVEQDAALGSHSATHLALSKSDLSRSADLVTASTPIMKVLGAIDIHVLSMEESPEEAVREQ